MGGMAGSENPIVDPLLNVVSKLKEHALAPSVPEVFLFSLHRGEEMRDPGKESAGWGR